LGEKHRGYGAGRGGGSAAAMKCRIKKTIARRPGKKGKKHLPMAKESSKTFNDSIKGNRAVTPSSTRREEGGSVKKSP